MHESRKKFILSVCFALFMRIQCSIVRFSLCRFIKSSCEKTHVKNQKKSLYKLCTFYYNSKCGSGL